MQVSGAGGDAGKGTDAWTPPIRWPGIDVEAGSLHGREALPSPLAMIREAATMVRIARRASGFVSAPRRPPPPPPPAVAPPQTPPPEEQVDWPPTRRIAPPPPVDKGIDIGAATYPMR